MQLITRAEAMFRVSKLSKKQLMVCWALAWGFRYDEIAEIMGCQKGNVHLIMTRALRNLKVTRAYQIPLILFLAQGIRYPEIVEYQP